MGKRGVGLPRLDFSRKWLETHGRDMKGCLLVVFTVNRLRTQPGMHGFGRARTHRRLGTPRRVSDFHGRNGSYLTPAARAFRSETYIELHSCYLSVSPLGGTLS